MLIGGRGCSIHQYKRITKVPEVRGKQFFATYDHNMIKKYLWFHEGQKNAGMTSYWVDRDYLPVGFEHTYMPGIQPGFSGPYISYYVKLNEKTRFFR